MRKFAKLFDVGDRQLIVYVEVDTDHEEDGKSVVHQITDLGRASIDMTIGGPDAAMWKLFEMYDQTAAENFFKIDIVAKAMEEFGDVAERADLP